MHQEPENPRLRWATILREQFTNRTDFLATIAPWGKPCPIKVDDEAHLTQLIRAHVLGEEVVCRFPTRDGGEAVKLGAPRIGFYTPAPGTNRTRWTCIDIDGKGGHKAHLEDAKAVALRIWDRAKMLGIPIHLELSNSGTGYHLWIFYETPVAAKLARDLGLALCPVDAKLAEPTRTGETLADAAKNRALEVFPKQADIGEDGMGNLVWAPWYHAAENLNCQFHHVVKGRETSGLVGKNDPRTFTPFETMTEEQARAALDRAGGWVRDEKDKTRMAASNEWAEWRRRALERLPLDAIYGQWLTGKESRARGWLECRDPASETGDRTPSAGVSQGIETERGVFKTFRTGDALSVFDFMVREGISNKFMDAVFKVADLSGVAVPAVTKTGGLEIPTEDRPQVLVTHTELHDLIRQGWDAIARWNDPPRLFRQAHLLVELHRNNTRAPAILGVSHHGLRDHLSMAAQWVRQGKDGPQVTFPPQEVARRMAEAAWDDIPALDQVVTSPFFDAHGNLVKTPGYHAPSRTWYADTGLVVRDVDPKPSPEAVNGALELLTDELLGGFPFYDLSSQCHALAMLLLPFVRRMIDGETPAHLVEANTPGTGKTLLAKALFALATGEPGDPKPLPRTEDEIQKDIFAQLREGPSVICYDNLPNKVILHSDGLLVALTASTIKGRILKASETQSVANRATWVLTGNNLRLSSELARRCIRIRLDAGVARPQDRPIESFPHTLPTWAFDARGDLVWALLTLVTNWISRGRPKPSSRLGGFEGWSHVVGGILEAAAVPGWLDNLPELYDEADSEAEEWGQLITVWVRSNQGQKANASTIAKWAEQAQVLPEGLRQDPRKMGLALNAHRDQVFGEWILRKGGTTGGVRMYNLERCRGLQNTKEE